MLKILESKRLVGYESKLMIFGISYSRACDYASNKYNLLNFMPQVSNVQRNRNSITVFGRRTLIMTMGLNNMYMGFLDFKINVDNSKATNLNK